MKGMNEYFERDRLWICLDIHIVLYFVNLYFGSLNNEAFITEIGYDPPLVHSHSALNPFVTKEGFMSASYWLSDSLELPGGSLCPFWQPEAARVDKIDYVKAWGCQGGQNGLCDSLGLSGWTKWTLWQPGLAGWKFCLLCQLFNTQRNYATRCCPHDVTRPAEHLGHASAQWRNQ